MVQSSNPGGGSNYFYSRVGDGELSITRIDGYTIAINKLSCEKCMMTEIQTNEGGKKDVSSLEWTTFIKRPLANLCSASNIFE